MREVPFFAAVSSEDTPPDSFVRLPSVAGSTKTFQHRIRRTNRFRVSAGCANVFTSIAASETVPSRPDDDDNGDGGGHTIKTHHIALTYTRHMNIRREPMQRKTSPCQRLQTACTYYTQHMSTITYESRESQRQRNGHRQRQSIVGSVSSQRRQTRIYINKVEVRGGHTQSISKRAYENRCEYDRIKATKYACAE